MSLGCLVSKNEKTFYGRLKSVIQGHTLKN